MAETVNLPLTRDELLAMLPEKDGDVQGVARVHDQMRNLLANFDAISEPDADSALAGKVRGSDVIILLKKLKDGGLGSAAFIKGVGSAPVKATFYFGEDDDPPLTIRQVQVTAGFKSADWKKMDRSALHEGESDAGA